MADTNDAFIAAKQAIIASMAGRKEMSRRRNVGGSTAGAKKTRRQAISSGATGGSLRPSDVSLVRTLVKAPLVLHSNAAATMNRRPRATAKGLGSFRTTDGLAANPSLRLVVQDVADALIE